MTETILFFLQLTFLNHVLQWRYTYRNNNVYNIKQAVQMTNNVDSQLSSDDFGSKHVL